jgi:hypothetical protein
MHRYAVYTQPHAEAKAVTTKPLTAITPVPVTVCPSRSAWLAKCSAYQCTLISTRQPRFASLMLCGGRWAEKISPATSVRNRRS